MTPGKVSIVILNWNQWAITAQCLNSLSMLDYPDFEVILVDNASDSPPPAEITSIIPDTVLIRNSANFGFGKLFAGGRGSLLFSFSAYNRDPIFLWQRESSQSSDRHATARASVCLPQ